MDWLGRAHAGGVSILVLLELDTALENIWLAGWIVSILVLLEIDFDELPNATPMLQKFQSLFCWRLTKEIGPVRASDYVFQSLFCWKLTQPWQCCSTLQLFSHFNPSFDGDWQNDSGSSELHEWIFNPSFVGDWPEKASIFASKGETFQSLFCWRLRTPFFATL